MRSHYHQVNFNGKYKKKTAEFVSYGGSKVVKVKVSKKVKIDRLFIAKLIDDPKIFSDIIGVSSVYKITSDDAENFVANTICRIYSKPLKDIAKEKIHDFPTEKLTNDLNGKIGLVEKKEIISYIEVRNLPMIKKTFPPPQKNEIKDLLLSVKNEKLKIWHYMDTFETAYNIMSENFKPKMPVI